MPGLVKRVLPDGKFHVRIGGDPDFEEEYTMSEEDIEWRLPHVSHMCRAPIACKSCAFPSYMYDLVMVRHFYGYPHRRTA